MKLLRYAWLLLALPAFGAEEDPRAALLRSVAVAREAHIEGDAAKLVALFADDFTAIDKGEITRPSRAAKSQSLR